MIKKLLIFTIGLLMVPLMGMAVNRYEPISLTESADSAKWFVFWVNSSVIQDSTAGAARSSVTNYDTTFSLNTDDTAYSLVLRIWYAGADAYGTYKVSVPRDSVNTMNLVSANMTQISGGSAAADNLEEAYDGDAIYGNGLEVYVDLGKIRGDVNAAESLGVGADGYNNAQLSNREHLFTNLDEVLSTRSKIGDTSLHGPEIIATIDSMYDSLGFYPDGVGGNLVLNPGFERDSVGGAAPEFWTQGDGTHTADISRTSTVGGRLDFRLDPAANETSFVYQKIGNLPDGDYLLSATGKSDVTSTAWVVLDNIVPTTVSTHIDSITFPTTFEEVGKLITLSSGTNTIFIGLRADGIAAGVPGDFDNIKLIYLGVSGSLTKEAVAREVWTIKSADDTTYAANTMGLNSQGWDATAAGGSDTANIMAMLLANFDLPPNPGSIRFIDGDGDNSDGLTIATAWTGFTNNVGDTADMIYYIMPGTYTDPVLTITKSNVTVEAVEHGTVFLRNLDDTLKANTIIQIGGTGSWVDNPKILGLNIAYKVSFTELPPDPAFQAGIWVYDSVRYFEIAYNEFPADSSFKSISIEDEVYGGHVHHNIGIRSRTHFIDAACDYSLFEFNIAMDQRDYLGGPSGANTTEPFQWTSVANHNVIFNNFATSGSVMYRIQGDTNLIAGNYAGKATFDDGREYMSYAVGGDSSFGNTFAGNWGPGHNLDTSGLGAGRKSLPVIRDLITSAHHIEDTILGRGATGPWTTGGNGSGDSTVVICAIDSSSAPDSLRSGVKITVRTLAGGFEGAQFTGSGGCSDWSLSADTFLVWARGSGYLWNPVDTIVVTSSTDTFNIQGYSVPAVASVQANVSNVYGLITDAEDNPIIDVLVTASIPISTTNTCDSTLLIQHTKSKRTDANGRFDLPLLYSSCIGGREWKFIIEHPYYTNREYSDSIPDSTSYRITWLKIGN